jgi:N-acetyl-gamma-glutamyl-phosphate reductase
LLRLLAGHPHAEISVVTANRAAGKPVAEVHRNLRERSDLVFEDADAASVVARSDFVFVALPNAQAGEAVEAVRRAGGRCVDLSGAFRLRDDALHREYYRFDPPAPDLRSEFVFGLTEGFRDTLKDAQAVANPGCFATAAMLALLPLAEQGWLSGNVIVNGVTGSSGSGADGKPGTHHPTRAQGFWSYRPLVHQHAPEIHQALTDLGAGEFGLSFVPHSAPFVRGIFATAYAQLPLDQAAKVEALYQERYGREHFVRVVPGTPDVNVVAGSNFADVSVAVRGTQVVVFCAIDNLVKGAAGQAVQNMNVMCGFDETAGLEFPGLAP